MANRILTNTMQTDESMTYAAHTAEMISRGWLRRTIVAIAATIPAEILGLDTYALLGLFIMLGLDWLTGLTRAKLNGEKITSSKMSKTILKATMYFCFLIKLT